jgi:hypothetical protein
VTARNSDELRRQLEALTNLDENSMDTALRTLLYRQDCPDTMVLGDYALGLLAAEAQAQTLQHLEMCPHCRAELARFADSVAQDPLLVGLEMTAPVVVKPDPTWVERALEVGRAWLEQESGRWRQVAVALVNLGQTTGSAPALSGLMGKPAAAASTGPRRLTIAPPEAGFELEINVSPDGDEACRVVVSLTLLDRFGDFSGAQVTLQWGSDVQIKQTDILGEATFRGLPCDQLDHMNLTMTLPD